MSTLASAITAQKTLAQTLRNGPFSLTYALRCAGDIAGSLRELHQSGRMHGAVSAEAVLLSAEGAELLPPAERQPYAIPAVDIVAFGALLYEMLTGWRPSPETHEAAQPSHIRPGEQEVYAAAMRLASQCLASASNSPAEMHRISSEILLLSARIKVADAETPAAPRAVSPPMFTPVATLYFGGSGSHSKPSGVPCPKCSAPYVHPSRTRTWFEDWLASWWNHPPMRCHRCLYRFIMVGHWRFEKGSPS